VYLPLGMVNAKCFYTLLSFFQSEQLNVNDPNAFPFFPPAGKAGNVPNELSALGGQIGVNKIRKRDNTTNRYIIPSNESAGYECPDPTLATRGCATSLLNPMFANGAVANPIVFSTWSLYMDGMQGAIGSDQQVENVLTVRNLIAASPLRDRIFPQNQCFTYTDSNIALRDTFRTYFGVDIAVIGAIAIIFLESISAGVITAAATSFIVYEVYALLSSMVHFNMLTATALFMSVGISVEFTAHLVAAYTMETGHLSGPKSKMTYAMSIVGPPFVLGALSTFFGNLPLAWSSLRFVKLYFFQAFGILVAVSVLNAFLFLPAKLMLKTMIGEALGLEKAAEGGGGVTYKNGSGTRTDAPKPNEQSSV